MRPKGCDRSRRLETVKGCQMIATGATKHLILTLSVCEQCEATSGDRAMHVHMRVLNYTRGLRAFISYQLSVLASSFRHLILILIDAGRPTAPRQAGARTVL